MSSLFKPKMPKIEPTPPPPTVDEAQQSRIEQRRLARRRGRGSTIMSTPASQQTGSVGVSRLLGGG
jgi:hypothetical protein